MREDFLDRPWLRDERDQPDVAAAVRALERKLLPQPRHEFRPGNPGCVVRAGLLLRITTAFRTVTVTPMPAGRGISPLADVPDRQRRDGRAQRVVRRKHPVITMPVLPRMRAIRSSGPRITESRSSAKGGRAQYRSRCSGGSLKSAIGYFTLMLAFPILVFLRFLLAPLSFLNPRLRQWVLENASSLTFNHRYTRKITSFDRKAITVMELLCFVRAAAIPAAVLLGAAPVSRIPLLYLLGLTTLVMNQMRQLADHHFSGDGSVSTVESHILDSCNFTGNDPLTLLFFPFSIRYHALHHLFPSLPYHNLKPAHAHLSRTLSADSPYHGLDQPGWWWVAKRTVFGGGEKPVPADA
jgi:hypothetical protein